jgi:hypothetical protein
VTLSGRKLNVVLYEVVVGQVWPRKTEFCLSSRSLSEEDSERISSITEAMDKLGED